MDAEETLKKLDIMLKQVNNIRSSIHQVFKELHHQQALPATGLEEEKPKMTLAQRTEANVKSAYRSIESLRTLSESIKDVIIKPIPKKRVPEKFFDSNVYTDLQDKLKAETEWKKRVQDRGDYALRTFDSLCSKENLKCAKRMRFDSDIPTSVLLLNDSKTQQSLAMHPHVDPTKPLYHGAETITHLDDIISAVSRATELEITKITDPRNPEFVRGLKIKCYSSIGTSTAASSSGGGAVPSSASTTASSGTTTISSATSTITTTTTSSGAAATTTTTTPGNASAIFVAKLTFETTTFKQQRVQAENNQPLEIISLKIYSPEEDEQQQEEEFSVMSRFKVFQKMTDCSYDALDYFRANTPKHKLQALLIWVSSYKTLFTETCGVCGCLLQRDSSDMGFLPPYFRSFRTCRALHIQCCGTDGYLY